MELKLHPDKVGRGDWIKLPPASIKIDPAHNIRDMKSERTRAHIEELKISIKAWGGVKDPIEGRMIDEDFYVTDGECRVTAVMEMIRDEGFECAGIICIKEAPGTDAKERILNFGVSGTKERYNELEMAEWCRRADRLGISHDEIAAAAGWKNKSSVDRHLKMLSDLPEPVQQQIRAGDVSATYATKLVKETPNAEELIRANLEENKRLGVGKKHKTSTKVTAKTIKRDTQKATGKAESEAPSTPTTTTAPAQPAATEEKWRATNAEEHIVTVEFASVATGETFVLNGLPMPLPARGAVQDLILALKPFAELANDHDLNVKDDSDLLEVFVRDVKRAWEVYSRIVGDTQNEEAA